MFGIQEIVSRTAEQRSAIEKLMDSSGAYDQSEASIYTGHKRSIQRELRESIRRIPLKEFLISGLAGASYLIPTKLADVLQSAAQPIDLAPVISVEVIMGWEGGDLKVDIVDRYSLKPSRAGSGGAKAPRTPNTSQATLSPIAFSTPLIAESSMMEDSQFPLVEWYARQAARAIAYESNDMILAILKTATDGVGTVNSSLTGDADETRFTSGTTSDLVTSIRKLGDDEWVPDTVVLTSEAWGHSVAVQTEPAGWTLMEPKQGFQFRLGHLDVILNNSPTLHAGTDARGAAMTNCVTIIFDRTVALLTGRKRWLLIEKYTDPVRDLEGAVVSCREDAVTINDDSIYVLTET